MTSIEQMVAFLESLYGPGNGMLEVIARNLKRLDEANQSLLDQRDAFASGWDALGERIVAIVDDEASIPPMSRREIIRLIHEALNDLDPRGAWK